MKKEKNNVNLSTLLLTFMKLGVLSFGGGATMLTLLRDEIVDKKHWMSDDELMEMTGIAESTPGPIAINLATYLGYKKRGIRGSIMATLGVVIPTFLIMFIISLFLNNILNIEAINYAFVGIKCAVVFLILKTGISLIKGLKGDILAICIFSIVVILMTIFTILAINFSSIYFILIGAVIGILFYGVIFAKRRVKK